MTLTQKSERVPDGWRITTEYLYGTGQGDEERWYAVRHWQTYETGFWLWRKSHTGWLIESTHPTYDAAVEYIVDTVRAMEMHRGS